MYAAEADDETAAHCSWILPLAHPLESWSDVRSTDGTYGICQPMIAPVTGARSGLEILSRLAGFEQADAQVVVKATAAQVIGGSFNDRAWQEALHEGFFKGSQAAVSGSSISTDAKTAAVPGAEGAASSPILVSDPSNVDTARLEVIILPSETIYDGRLANNAWLQECPQPITKLTWDNAALMSVATARKLGVKQGELIVIRQADANAKVPTFIVPGMAEGTIVCQTGYGRTRAGTVAGADGKYQAGHSLKSLRTWNQAYILTGVEVTELAFLTSLRRLRITSRLKIR